MSALVALLPVASTPVRADEQICAGTGVLCAGAASVDMTWHTGSGQGQYGSPGNGLTSDKFDPFHHQTKQVPSDGMQSRTYAKAIVVKGADGTKVAYVKTEMYLQQDVLTRRVAELVSGTDPLVQEYRVEGLDGSSIMLGATHNHSAPEYASTAWGVWLFTDTFDFRMFETTARKVAAAIRQADENLVPAKIGASVTRFDGVQGNVIGPAVAIDGTPAGFPRDHFDDELTVIRFDKADGSEPIAAWVNLGMHPESLDTTDLISSDFVGMTERIVERGMGRQPGSDGGPIVAWSQGNVGDVEPDRSGAHPPSEGREYWHRDFAQAERMSADLAAAVLDTWRDVEAGTPDVPEKFVQFSTDVPVAMIDYHVAGPETHPLPTVSNCRTDQPGVPVIGLPDCGKFEEKWAPEQLGTTIDLLQSAGIPVPDNYGVTMYTGAPESLRIHLQAIRLGDILIASCPCEPISDMTLNFKSRVDASTENLYAGYEWPCEERADGTYCDFRHASWQEPDWRKVDTSAYERMLAQIRNDASGWEQDYASLQGAAEAEDTQQIYGNFTHKEIQDLACGEPACSGYRLPIMVGQANDYVGYVVTYREYMRGDHYRKALTAFGPHTSDYINTRLVAMGAQLQGGAPLDDAVHEPPIDLADELIQLAKAMAAGRAGNLGTAAYEAAIPDDGGTPGAAVSEPQSLERFGAATFTWEGGSNWTDNPVVVAQRQTPEGWQTVATQEGGEIVLTLEYDSYFSDAPLQWLTGGKVYRWTATWEVFEHTEPGTYRFFVEGHHRSERAATPYEVASQPFDVAVWKGIHAHDLTVDPAAGTASFFVDGVELTTPEDQLETDDDAVLAPDEVHFPDTYDSDLDYIQQGVEQVGPHRYCWRCTFRPWADSGRIAAAEVTMLGSDGSATTSPATRDGASWVATDLELFNGDVVMVERGGVADEFGNVNGEPSNEVVVEGFRDRPTSRVETTLTYTGATSGVAGKKAKVSATLTDQAGAPLAGKTITFTRGDQTTSAITRRDGEASSSIVVEGSPEESTPLVVEFAGHDGFAPARLEVPFTTTEKRGGKEGGSGKAFNASAFAAISAPLLALAAWILSDRPRRRYR